MNEGGSTRVRGTSLPKSADVVFVVEERTCMKWSKAKLTEFARLIQGELGRKSQRDVKYGVVGFNGEGVHYKLHYHTGWLTVRLL